MKSKLLEPIFIDVIPRKLEPHKIYISMVYATSAHLCASGCGNKVILPFSPAEWKLLFDGTSITLTPSIGNWEYPCRAHYWIRNNKILWASSWSKERIEQGRKNDQRDLDSLHNNESSLDADKSIKRNRDSTISIFKQVKAYITYLSGRF